MKRTKHIWRSMWNRCGGLKGDVKGAAKYKGIITVCDRWRSFENFISDMGLAPEGYSLDRIENSKGYYRENCRWATAKEQTRNRSITVKVQYLGKEWFLKDLAEHLGIRYDTLWNRLKNNWEPSRWGDKPNKGSGAIQRRTRFVTFKGKEYLLGDLAKELKIPPETLWSRVKRGWGDDQLPQPVDASI